jgi:hypothetical protein
MLGVAAYAALTTGFSANAATQNPSPTAAAPAEGEIFPEPQSGRTLIIGEFHGTAEIPAAFLGLVRRTARLRPVLVGIEMPRSAGRLRCRPGGRLSPAWLPPQQDGRTSAAMRDLVCALRAGAFSRRVRVVYLADEGERGSDFDSKAAGRFHDALARRRGAAGLILTGSFHARNSQGTIAQHLRSLGAQVDTVVVSAPAGRAWFCPENGACGPGDVRVNFCSQRPPTAQRPYWYSLRSVSAPWDYCLSLPNLSASPPAAHRRAPRE